MKNIIRFKIFLLSIAILSSCSYDDTDFGFDGIIKGKVTDNADKPLYGDLTSNAMLVKALGKGDKVAVDIRVNGEGNFQNLKMFPKEHKVWLEGPIVKSDTFVVNFATTPENNLNFKVVPLLSPKIESSSVNGTAITLNYSILQNTASAPKKMEIYCSTVKYPTASTGTLTNVYSTKIVAITTLNGAVVVSGLTAGTKYYLRIGAQATSSPLMNFSNQIEVSLP